MSPTGPNYPGTIAQDSSGTQSWTNLNNAKLEDGSVASAFQGAGGGGGVANELLATNFSFNIPTTAVIDGIKLEIKVSTTGGVNASDSGLIYLLYNGGHTSTSNTPNIGQTWSASGLSWNTYGGSSSLWGKSWTPADINNSSFGAALSAFTGVGTATINVDAVRITIYWHTAPTDVPKRYVYQSFDSAGNYQGNIPNVTSDFAFSQDINTVGSQITITCVNSIDTASQSVNTLTDEAGNTLTDESSSNLSDEGSPTVVQPGTSTQSSLIKNGNRIIVIEYSYYWPNGKVMFQGYINRIETSFGGEANDETINLLVYSDGADMDNYIARGSPFSYTTDQSQTTQNSSGVISAGLGYSWFGQSFTTGSSVTNIGAITVYLNGTATVTLSLYNSVSVTTPLATVTQNVSSNGPVTFSFASPVVVSGSRSYFFGLTVPSGQSININYQNTNPYSGGQLYSATYSGGGGGGAWTATAGSDLYFTTGSSTGSTTATYSTQDPSTGMLEGIINDYVGRGGLINYGSGTIAATGLSLTYTFNTNTVYEALKAILSLSPDGFYYYTDLGTSTLYFKQASTTADILLTKGKHLTALKFIMTIENVKNQVYFSGGATAGVNLYKTYSDLMSISKFGVKLDRKSDNRVTVAATADAIGKSEIAELKDEQYQTTCSIIDKSMDITLIKPGMVVGFSGFGNFIDFTLLQIVRVDYKPEKVDLTLGILPKRVVPEFERITRGLIAEQTIDNPGAPS